MSAPIRTAVVGFGLAGQVFHCPFVDAVPGLELTVIVQRRGDEALRAYPHARILRSVDEAIADPSIELIVVGTPNVSHVPIATAALQAGKHVVVDKPLAATSAEVRSLIELSQVTGKLLAPFHNRRFDGDFLTLRKLLDAGSLGRVIEISSRFDRYSPVSNPGAWRDTAGPAHGVFFDLGPHLVDQAITLYGNPVSITASIGTEREGGAADDSFDVTLEFAMPGGHTLRYLCGGTVLAVDPAPRYKVRGTHGSFTKYGVDPQEPTILAGQRPPKMGSAEAWLLEPESAWGTLSICADPQQPSAVKQTTVATEPGDYRPFYANVRDAIRGEAKLAIPAEDAWRTIRLLELAVTSSDERCTVSIEDLS